MTEGNAETVHATGEGNFYQGQEIPHEKGVLVVGNMGNQSILVAAKPGVAHIDLTDPKHHGLDWDEDY